MTSRAAGVSHGVHLPPFAAYPPLEYRQKIAPSDWDRFLQAYTILAEAYLKAAPNVFEQAIASENGLQTFIKTYLSETSQQESLSQHAGQLRRRVFLLTHRALTQASSNSTDFLTWKFLSSLCRVFLKTKSLADLIQWTWQHHEAPIKSSLNQLRNGLTKTLEGNNPDTAAIELKGLAPLLHTSPHAASYMAEGSELLDALAHAYTTASTSTKESMVPVAFLALTSLTKPETLNRSALIDHLYSLKAQAEQNKGKVSLLADLVTNTPLLTKLAGEGNEKGIERARTLAASLQSFKMPSIARTRAAKPSKSSKGNGPAQDSNRERHIHLLSKITQVQDLFPDLGEGFVARLLDSYEENVETVISHLLEQSLPPDLASLDRSLPLPSTRATQPAPDSQSAIDALVPRSTPSPPPNTSRRNVFDNDAFDRLEIDSSKYHRGHAPTSDNIFAQQAGKASILSALAAFDSDDDERDDTYDEADVGGTVDHAAPDGETDDIDVGGDMNEEALYRAWKGDVGLFGRANEVRRSEGRRKLKEMTGMTDEGIEGWAIMLGRDPRRQRRLEERYSGFDGRQNAIERTSYIQREDDEEGSDGASRGGYRGRGSGRGRGRGRGRGGNVAGQSSDAGTQVARQRKDANKGSRANHNRRDQRAKKMARGGSPG